MSRGVTEVLLYRKITVLIRRTLTFLAKERPLKIIGATGVLLALSACNAVYVHDEAAQKATQSAATAWKNAVIEKVFDDQRASLQRLAADEVEAAKLEIAAQRDLQLVQLLENRNVTADLVKRLEGLVGEVVSLAELASARDAISNARFVADRSRLQINQILIGLKRDGYRGTMPSCGNLALVLSSDMPESDASNLLSRLSSMVQPCGVLADAEGDINLKIAAAAGGGKLREIAETLVRYRAEVENQQARADVIKAILEKKKMEIRSASDPAALALRFCLADPTAALHRAAAATPNADATLDDARPNGEKSPSEKESCRISVDPAKLIAGVDPIVRRMKHLALRDEIQAVVTALLSKKAEAVSGKPDAQASIALSPFSQAAIDTLETLKGLEKPDINSLLVALAYQQYQVDIATAEVNTLTARISVFDDLLEARLTEAAFIAKALQEIEGADLARGKTQPSAEELRGVAASVGRVRAYVNASWNVGAYRATLAEYANDDLTRADSLRRGSVIAAGWRNILQPAIDQLVAYGSGGIDKQTISNLILSVVNTSAFATVLGRVN